MKMLASHRSTDPLFSKWVLKNPDSLVKEARTFNLQAHDVVLLIDNK